MARYKALVIGGLGVIGRNLVNHLTARDDWQVAALSRRSPDFPTRARFISVDALDPADCRAKLAGLTDLTHIFFCALHGGIAAENVEANLALLVNPLAVVEPINPGLERIVLQQGGKVYGRHLGPYKTPAFEDDPRHMPPNFYYDQEDHLRALQRGKRWTWAALRPEAVMGYAVGNPMNIMMTVAVYAAVSKEMGLPLRFPGKPGCLTCLYQFTDAGLLARATEWAAAAPAAANQAYNVTNGDGFRWGSLWAKLAEFFAMPLGTPIPLSLTAHMADKGPVWDGVVARHGLVPTPYAQAAMWPFADFNFATDWDILQSDTKRIRAGFTEVVGTEPRFLELLAEFRANRIIP